MNIKPLNNIHIKLLALISAIILWFIVITTENNVIKFNNPIQVTPINLSENLSLEGALPTVDVYLKMDKSEIANISTSDIHATVNLLNLSAGSHTVKVNVDGQQIKVLKIVPSMINITLSPIIEKEVKINIVKNGDIKENYLIKSIDAETSKVKIRGAKTIIDKIDEVNMNIQFNQTEDKTFTTILNPTLKDNLKEYKDLITITPSQIAVNIKIKKDINEKEVKIVPIFIGTNTENYINKIAYSPKTVTIIGGKSDLENINTIETEPIDITKLSNTETKNFNLSFNEDISLKDPKTQVSVKLKTQVSGPTI